MNVSEAIVAFAQSEKVKSSLIWVSQTIEILKGLPAKDRPGAEKMIGAIITLIVHEVHLSGKLSRNSKWLDIEKHIDMAMVMLNSGVAQESIFHLTRALTRVTDIGQLSMHTLQREGLL